MPDTPVPPVEVPDAEAPSAHLPLDRPKEPTVRAPVGACDSHLHMVAGPEEFPLWEGRDGGRTRDLAAGRGFEEWLRLLRVHLDTLGCTRGVVVQSILYGADNHVTIEAVRRLGEQFRGVALVTDEIQDGTLDRLAEHRMKAVRLNLVHGGQMSWDGVRAMAPRLAERDLHLEILLHADRHIEPLADGIEDLPVPVVIDHCGWPSDGRTDGPATDQLCRLLETGRVWVKLSGQYRFTEPPYYEGADWLIERLVAANPERCVWGSDWPHLLLGQAQMPDSGVLFDAFTRAIDAPATRQRVLVDNPAALYGF